MTDTDSTGRPTPKQGGGCGRLLTIFVVLGIVAILVGVALGPIGPGVKYPVQNSSVQNARSLCLAMFGYANDHDGNYPDAKSSTEAFQELLDGGYVTDPAIFYLPLPGKTKANPGQKLKSENVAWDVTGGADKSSSDWLPLVFVTGYKVNYAPGGAAIPLGANAHKSSRSDFFFGRSHQYAETPGIAVAYRNNNAKFMLELLPNNDGSIPNFIPADFNPAGKTYRQLTPDGPLPGK